MKKAALLLLIIFAFAFTSCIKSVVSYCPYCGKSNIREISTYNPKTGMNESYYECLNDKCHCIYFGAGMVAE